jgi:hypothetical protein
MFRQTGEPAMARRDLDEAMRMARRSEMQLFQCDAHLEYARLALAEGDREKARGHVGEARRLVEDTRLRPAAPRGRGTGGRSRLKGGHDVDALPATSRTHGTNPLAREVLHARWRAGRVAVVIG